jgi:two-component system cell cycle response regulator DivK
MAIPNSTHVVIVEDNQNNLVVIMKLLHLAGIDNCHWDPSGRAVVAFVKAMSLADSQRRPDLILLDIGLPHEDGYGVLASLRSDPALQQTRVVAVTAVATPTEMQRAREAGFDGFIGKPIDGRRFPDQIRRVLAGEGVWEI